MTLDEIEILDPTGEGETSSWPLSHPLDARQNAHFGLLDISKPTPGRARSSCHALPQADHDAARR
jgi:hypothetical protein